MNMSFVRSLQENDSCCNVDKYNILYFFIQSITRHPEKHSIGLPGSQELQGPGFSLDIIFARPDRTLFELKLLVLGLSYMILPDDNIWSFRCIDSGKNSNYCASHYRSLNIYLTLIRQIVINKYQHADGLF
jgi:hypothetical protein